MHKKILIIDDDIDICTVLSRFLNNNGYDSETAFTANGGLSKFKETNYDIVITDYRLGERCGKDVLLEVKKLRPETIVIIITGYAHIKTAVEVVKSGAYDYISKPLVPEEVLKTLSNAVSNIENTLKDQPTPKTSKASKSHSSENFIIGRSKVAQQLFSHIEMIAPTNYSVILYGETGTGKEMVAKKIHEKSNRSSHPFVAVDCGAISKDLAGSALFGHIKGAFTGAIADKEGHFETANNGTIFLDEVANLSYEVQAILLRVIQERKLKKVGDTKEKELDIRVIVASNENLLDATKTGKFREDLYHRFNEFTLHIPALRNRSDDIPIFADYFLEKANKELNKNITGFHCEVMNVFYKYLWPGNLRELRNVVRRAVLLTKSGNIELESLPSEILHQNSEIPNAESIAPSHSLPKNEFDIKEAAARAEYETIMNVLRDVKYNKSKAAEILKIDRKTLYNKIKMYEESLKNV